MKNFYYYTKNGRACNNVGSFVVEKKMQKNIDFIIYKVYNYFVQTTTKNYRKDE